MIKLLSTIIMNFVKRHMEQRRNSKLNDKLLHGVGVDEGMEIFNALREYSFSNLHPVHGAPYILNSLFHDVEFHPDTDFSYLNEFAISLLTGRELRRLLTVDEAVEYVVCSIGPSNRHLFRNIVVETERNIPMWEEIVRRYYNSVDDLEEKVAVIKMVCGVNAEIVDGEIDMVPPFLVNSRPKKAV